MDEASGNYLSSIFLSLLHDHDQHRLIKQAEQEGRELLSAAVEDDDDTHLPLTKLLAFLLPVPLTVHS